MKLIAVREINDVEVVATDWCECHAHEFMAVSSGDENGSIRVKMEHESRMLSCDDLLCCYADVTYLGAGRYLCIALREVDTLTDDERDRVCQYAGATGGFLAKRKGAECAADEGGVI